MPSAVQQVHLVSSYSLLSLLSISLLTWIIASIILQFLVLMTRAELQAYLLLCSYFSIGQIYLCPESKPIAIVKKVAQLENGECFSCIDLI